MTKRQLIIIIVGVIAVLVVFFIYGFFKADRCTPVALEVWGVYDESEIIQEFIQSYIKENKCVRAINYVKKPYADYEKDLINAFASGKGPDIWLMNRAWLSKHKDKITEISEKELPLATFKQMFVDVAEQDLVDNGKIYGLPMYVDTLALLYNKDIFNSTGISFPPETWEDLINDLGKLIVKNQWGNIERAGIALGTAENINRSVDILYLLMLQNGTKMVSSDKKTATFNEYVNLDGETYYPGKDALRFYTDFSNPAKTVYTWNRQMSYSVDAFANGETAMVLTYAYHIPTIRSKAPYLNFGIAPSPQIKGREFDVNYANYWAWTVSKKSKSPSEAWKFLLYLTNKENSKRYAQRTDRPAARRDLIDWQKTDNLDLTVFAGQSLSARSWYQIDETAIDTIFSNAIESIVLGSATIDNAIATARDQITLLMKK